MKSFNPPGENPRYCVIGRSGPRAVPFPTHSHGTRLHMDPHKSGTFRSLHQVFWKKASRAVPSGFERSGFIIHPLHTLEHTLAHASLIPYRETVRAIPAPPWSFPSAISAVGQGLDTRQLNIFPYRPRQRRRTLSGFCVTNCTPRETSLAAWGEMPGESEIFCPRIWSLLQTSGSRDPVISPESRKIQSTFSNGRRDLSPTTCCHHRRGSASSGRRQNEPTASH